MLQDMSASVISDGPNSLAGMALIDQTESEHGTVHCMDAKHNIKRFRERDKSLTGMLFTVDGLSLNPETLKELFLLNDPSCNFTEIFDPDDK